MTNNEFVNASVITGVPTDGTMYSTDPVSNIGFTGETNSAASPPILLYPWLNSKQAWWSWTPTEPGWINYIRLVNADYYTTDVMVFTGSDITNLELVSAGGWNGFGLVEAGTTYHLRAVSPNDMDYVIEMSVGSPAPKFSTFTESFDDLSAWTVSGYGTAPVVVGGRAKFQGPSLSRISPVARYDLTSSSVYCAVIGSGTSASFEMGVHDEATINSASVTVRLAPTSTLKMKCYPDQLTITYDPVEHLWIRINQTAAGITSFDTSPDSQTWTTQFTSAVSLPITVGEFRIGSVGGESSLFYVDNINIVPSPPPVSTEPPIVISNLNVPPWLQFDAPVFRGYSPPTWVWSVGPWNDTQEHDFLSIAGRTLTVKLHAPDEASFTLSTYDADALDEQGQDLWIYRNGTLMFRGPIMSTSDTDVTVSVSARDYAAMFEHRFYRTPDYAVRYFLLPEPREDILWEVITNALEQPGMSLGITKGSWPVLNTDDYPVPVYFDKAVAVNDGELVSNVISELTQLDNGFDFWIDPQRKANIAAKRGSFKGAVLDYGGTVQTYSRSFDLKDYANYIRVMGSVSANAPWYSEFTPDHPGDRGWAQAIADSKPDWEEAVKARGKYLLDKALAIKPSWSVTLASGMWEGPDHIWVGDTCDVAIKHGRHNVYEKMRVMDITISIDQNEMESVSITLNYPNDPVERMRRFVSSIQYRNSR